MKAASGVQTTKAAVETQIEKMQTPTFVVPRPDPLPAVVGPATVVEIPVMGSPESELDKVATRAVKAVVGAATEKLFPSDPNQAIGPEAAAKLMESIRAGKKGR